MSVAQMRLMAQQGRLTVVLQTGLHAAEKWTARVECSSTRTPIHTRWPTDKYKVIKTSYGIWHRSDEEHLCVTDPPDLYQQTCTSRPVPADLYQHAVLPY
ncbi:hypothetical protein P4O66_022434 [Electrophorus voltai]|uniref:Uncharacterized protein n=1 Tax=Electrophorus voltai TaxID=2609070 RepID=A0AAD8ZLV2_9TELE|nr:hypothetical protein P4O66_022434 [Electrophorus voltai]